MDTITLDKRLKALAGESESVQTLYHSYVTLKNELKKYLPAVFSYYPHYSAHDSSHSQSLITSIEQILGERRLDLLSAADIWLLLVSAHMHDVGMIVTNDEIAGLVEKEEFRQYLNEMKKHGDSDFARAAAILADKKIPDGNPAWFMDIKQSVILLAAEYYRRQHAKRSDDIASGEAVFSKLLSLKLNGVSSRAFALVGKI